MYDAYEFFQLLKFSVNIESIAAYDVFLFRYEHAEFDRRKLCAFLLHALLIRALCADDNLLVGTKVGHLLMYSISYRFQDNKYEVQLRRYNKSFSKKAIQQLSVVPELQLLVSLSDNIIAIHNMKEMNFPCVCTISETKGATLFSLDVQRTPTLSANGPTGATSVIVRLCVAVKRKLHLYYWKNGAFLKLMDEVVLPDTPKALAWVKETICVGFKGDSPYTLYHLNRNQESDDWWIPLCPPGNSYPSVLSMNEKVFILGKDKHSIFVDTNGDPATFKQIKWDKVPRDLVYDEPYLVAVFPESIEIRTVEPSLVIQVHELEEPYMICRCRSGFLYVASSTHVWLLQNINWSRQIHFLLEQKQFQLALKIAYVSDDNGEDMMKNVHQIRTLYAYDLFNKKQFKESMDEFRKLDTDPCEVIQLFPNLLPQQARKTAQTDAVVKLDEVDLESGLVALMEYLRQIRLDKKSEKEKKDKEYLERQKIRQDIQNNAAHLTHAEIDAEDKKYHQFSRATEQLLQIIDTTLLKCYLQTNHAFIAPLLRLNHCHLGEAEKMLKKYDKCSELIILYQTKGLHQKALDLLQKQSSQSDPSLQGHERTVTYLQHLGAEHIDLIFQYASWVLEAHPDDGLSIFIEDTPEARSLPKPKVLDYLLRLHKNLVTPYLEHIIHVWDEKAVIFHNALVHQYLEEAQQLHREGRIDKEKAVRAKLLIFLELSDCYTPETVLVKFPYDSMFEERAVVLGKLGRHEQVLSIYVMILADVKRAVQYCNQVYSLGKKGSDEVYVLLIKMLISPPDSWLVGVQVSPATSQPDLETALTLLEEHATKIQPLQALEVLPDKVPLCRIRHFLETSLQQQLRERRRLSILKGLVSAENLQVQQLRMQYESHSIKMTEMKVCSVCKKRFGNQSAFARFPDGDIVHYSCQDRKEST